ncbi:unnamed protein product [Moneuplotes crassus]|uniref:HTH CENPB-type domain-containing protein n=1 Tax=Euplotes crassus TaxID=5936 RepID=A0AAD1ULT1_EUPCR|nr:unnamed protein product [Moneuplotes crassus]
MERESEQSEVLLRILMQRRNELAHTDMMLCENIRRIESQIDGLISDGNCKDSEDDCKHSGDNTSKPEQYIETSEQFSDQKPLPSNYGNQVMVKAENFSETKPRHCKSYSLSNPKITILDGFNDFKIEDDESMVSEESVYICLKPNMQKNMNSKLCQANDISAITYEHTDNFQTTSGIKQETQLDQKILSKVELLSKQPKEDISGCKSVEITQGRALEQTVSSTSRKRRSKYTMYPAEFKEIAISMALEVGTKEASKNLEVPIKSLKRWMIVGAQRKKGGGRKTRHPQMEETLKKWILQCKRENVDLNMEVICQKARVLSQDESFKASKGWYCKFIQKVGFQK